MSKKTIAIIVALALVAAFFIFGGLDLFDSCKPPIRVTKTANELEKGKVRKLMSGKDVALYVSSLNPQERDESHYNLEGKEALLIQSGQGIIHSGKVTPNGVKWARDTKVSDGDFIEIDQMVATQLENSGNENLVILIAITKSNKSDNRKQAEPYVKEANPCR